MSYHYKVRNGLSLGVLYVWLEFKKKYPNGDSSKLMKLLIKNKKI